MADEPSLYGRIFGNTDALAQQVQVHPEFMRAKSTGQPTQFKVGEWNISVGQDGSVSASRGSLVKPLLAAGAVFGGGLALGGMIPGIPGVGMGGNQSAGTAATYGGARAAGADAMAGMGGAAAAGGGAFSRLLPYLINSGLRLGGSLIAQNQTNKAVEAQRQAAQQVMGLARDVYGQQRADQQPFLEMGTNGARTLGHLLGISR